MNFLNLSTSFNLYPRDLFENNNKLYFQSPFVLILNMQLFSANLLTTKAFN